MGHSKEESLRSDDLGLKPNTIFGVLVSRPIGRNEITSFRGLLLMCLLISLLDRQDIPSDHNQLLITVTS